MSCLIGYYLSFVSIILVVLSAIILVIGLESS